MELAGGHTKQWVFVDEYNRHKRLKVMRACDGCRKRKIRCDGALNNGPWPCGACVRLKLKCVPPTLDQDDEHDLSSSTPPPGQFIFQSEYSHSLGKRDDAAAPVRPPVDWNTVAANAPNRSSASPSSQASYSLHLYSHQDGSRFDPSAYATDGTLLNSSPHPSVGFYRQDTDASAESVSDPQEVDATMRELSGQMGDLNIDTLSVAPYIINERRNLAETPAVEEPEYILPLSATSDPTAKIPIEMMPSDERVLDYFGYFFDYVHPYVPVLNRATLYEQWRSARHSISPLILEGIFACVARYLEENLEVQKWLALAARHEESFKDVPRVSTIQGMILLMKARESIAKRGYYYRSWMSVKYMTDMAIDLGMHEHLAQHRAGTCKLGRVECEVRTRIWQTIFTLEIVVGAPAGRMDFAIDVETLDCNPTPLTPEADPFEYQTGRRWAYMTQASRNIRLSNILMQKLRRERKDWALDAQFVQRNEDIAQWIKQLPSDVRLHFPDDGSPPWLGGLHIVAYIYIWHYLVVLMHHRPQLQAFLEAKDQRFREELETCTQAAGMMCRVQEALIRDFGVHGLQFMLRGVNFTIYSILTCTMLHLAAITSPDPAQNSHARTYFTRHMRVLEHCLPSANPDMQAQINTLREAFSNDITHPFELKATLGLRSPSIGSHPTPPSLRDSPLPSSIPQQQTWNSLEATPAKTVSPASDFGRSFVPNLGDPTSMPYSAASSYAVPSATNFPTQNLRGVAAAPGYDLSSPPTASTSLPVWDPSGIFIQWNMAFGNQSQAHGPAAQTPDSRYQTPPAGMLAHQQSPSNGRNLYSPQDISSQPLPDTTPMAPAVTPLMWQDAFTTAYVSGHGQKRYREASVDHSNGYNQYTKRRG